jgi:hypothetical protein
MLMYLAETYILCIKKVFAVAIKKTGLEVNADNIKHMVILRNKNPVKNHNRKTHNKTSERVEQVMYLGTTLTNQNSVNEN